MSNARADNVCRLSVRCCPLFARGIGPRMEKELLLRFLNELSPFPLPPPLVHHSPVLAALISLQQGFVRKRARGSSVSSSPPPHSCHRHQKQVSIKILVIDSKMISFKYLYFNNRVLTKNNCFLPQFQWEGKKGESSRDTHPREDDSILLLLEDTFLRAFLPPLLLSFRRRILRELSPTLICLDRSHDRGKKRLCSMGIANVC